MSSPYRLVRNAPTAAAAVTPDEAQQRVLDHAGGPLLVLAGPGTGKTTTLVEAVAQRVLDGVTPEQVLVLTFSRKAAQELRDRITARLGTPVAGPSAWTFHAFCFSLVQEFGGEALRLLSGPEQDVALRELLSGSQQSWPEQLQAALGTRGLAEQVRGLLSRARELGLEPEQLGHVGKQEGRADWQALASFFGEYLDVLDAQGALDYAELVHRAVLLVERPEVRAQLRERYRSVFVDEYQDTDPAQERLLQALAGDGRDLVVVGDPDQSIYAFRGAEVRWILEFPDRFPTATGARAPVVALQTCRRSGRELLDATRRFSVRIPSGAVGREHRALVPGPGVPRGSVEVATHPSVGAEADAIADLLRREHLELGTPWSRMAVLVRSGARSVPLLRRVLAAAGVPVEVAGDELPLAQEPAVAPLLTALRVVADARTLTAETARSLLLSPLVGAEPVQLRRLGRELRALDVQESQRDGGLSRLAAPSAELLRQAVADRRHVLLLDASVAAPVVRLATLLDRARAALDDGPEAVLWQLWHTTGWPSRLERASIAGGAAGRAADRDLDAVVALFSALGRAAEQREGRAGVTALLEVLEAQQIPGDTLAERGVRGDAVRLLTAHRSKGLEWEVVVVAGVQEGVWPDLRRRGSLLESDRLGPEGLREPTGRAELLADERRLFYVAATRARRRLVVTAVHSPEEDGERPSRLLGELGVEPVVHTDRPTRVLALPALVAALRRLAVDPAVSEGARRAAATRLARLAAEQPRPDGAPLVADASPERWWGLVETTHGDRPVQDPSVAVPLSGSSLASLDTCPLQWFLAHEVHAEAPTTTAMGFGSVVHALAHEVARGRTAPDLAALTTRLDTVWDQLGYDAPWQSQQQHDAALEALARFLRWHASRPQRELVATEVPFVVEVPVGDVTVRLRGFMDRVELDEDGRVHVVDLKTGKGKPSGKELEKHPQLGTYQLAVRYHALDEVLPGEQVLGGAELVHLRQEAGAKAALPGGPVVQEQVALPEGPGWVDVLLETAVDRVLGERFSPVRQSACDRCAFRSSCPAQPEGRQVVA